MDDRGIPGMSDDDIEWLAASAEDAGEDVDGVRFGQSFYDPPRGTTYLLTSPTPLLNPAIKWGILYRLAADPRFKAGQRLLHRDVKPSGEERDAKCKACGVKYPCGPVCGYCRGRVAMIRSGTLSRGWRSPRAR